MITLESIQLLNVGDTVCEAFIYVSRRADSTTGKPRYRVVAEREKPYLAGSVGAFSPLGAFRYVKWFRKL
jgi:hypothetical protein